MVRLLNAWPRERQTLATALARIRALVEGETLSRLGLDRLRHRLMAFLDGTKRLAIRCGDAGDRSSLTFLTEEPKGLVIEVSRSAFSLGDGRIAARLFRELVRACGGSTLDAEALQHHCFPGVGPAPSPEAFQRFAHCPLVAGMRVGAFVLWDPRTGELFVRRDSRKSVTRGARLRPTFRSGVRHQAAPPAPVPAEGAEESEESPAPSDAGEPANPEEGPLLTGWIERPVPITALLGDVSLPPEAGALVRELLQLGQHTPEEWNRILRRMTEMLLEKPPPQSRADAAARNSDVTPFSPERSPIDDGPTSGDAGLPQ